MKNQLKYTTALVALLAFPLAGSAMAENSATNMNSQGQWNNTSTSSVSTSADLEQKTVTNIQQKLNARGYNAGPIDGIWGSRTSSALESFQDAKGLKATGRPDSMTLANLGINAQSSGSMKSESDTDSSMQNRSKSNLSSDIDANVDAGVDASVGGARVDTDTRLDTGVGVGLN